MNLEQEKPVYLFSKNLLKMALEEIVFQEKEKVYSLLIMINTEDQSLSIYNAMIKIDENNNILKDAVIIGEESKNLKFHKAIPLRNEEFNTLNHIVKCSTDCQDCKELIEENFLKTEEG